MEQSSVSTWSIILPPTRSGLCGQQGVTKSVTRSCWDGKWWGGGRGGLELPLSTYIYELVKRGGGERAERFRMTEELIFAKFWKWSHHTCWNYCRKKRSVIAEREEKRQHWEVSAIWEISDNWISGRFPVYIQIFSISSRYVYYLRGDVKKEVV